MTAQRLAVKISKKVPECASQSACDECLDRPNAEHARSLRFARGGAKSGWRKERRGGKAMALIEIAGGSARDAAPEGGLTFPDGFNVATVFIDRHLAEGRSGKVAVRTAAGDTTYGELASGVNRCANLLVGLGLGRGERVLMVVKDSIDVLPSVLGGDQGRHRAGAAQHPAARQGLRLHDRQRRMRGAGLFAGVRRRGRGGTGAVAAPAGGGAAGGRGRRHCRRAACRPVRPLRCGAGLGRGRLLLALFVGLDRRSQGRGAPPSRHGGDQRVLRRARRSASARTTCSSPPPSCSSPTASAMA